MTTLKEKLIKIGAKVNFFTDGFPLCGAPATTPWHYDAVEERPSISSATVAMSRSRWPRSQFREVCSQISSRLIAELRPPPVNSTA